MEILTDPRLQFLRITTVKCTWGHTYLLDQTTQTLAQIHYPLFKDYGKQSTYRPELIGIYRWTLRNKGSHRPDFYLTGRYTDIDGTRYVEAQNIEQIGNDTTRTLLSRPIIGRELWGEALDLLKTKYPHHNAHPKTLTLLPYNPNYETFNFWVAAKAFIIDTHHQDNPEDAEYPDNPDYPQPDPEQPQDPQPTTNPKPLLLTAAALAIALNI